MNHRTGRVKRPSQARESGLKTSVGQRRAASLALTCGACRRNHESQFVEQLIDLVSAPGLLRAVLGLRGLADRLFIVKAVRPVAGKRRVSLHQLCGRLAHQGGAGAWVRAFAAAGFRAGAVLSRL